jgi:hypothetical protein
MDGMEEKNARKDPATEPLSIPGKILAFLAGSLGCGIVTFQMTGNAWNKFISRGEKRKAADVWRWFGFGFLSVIVLIAALGVLFKLKLISL